MKDLFFEGGQELRPQAANSQVKPQKTKPKKKPTEKLKRREKEKLEKLEKQPRREDVVNMK